MGADYIKKKLENRILSTLRLDPSLTYLEALELVLRSIGVLTTLSSRTANRSEHSVKNGTHQGGETDDHHCV